MEESNNYYAMGGTNKNKPNVYSNARTTNKRNNKGNRRVHQANTYNEDEQFKQLVEMFSNFVLDLNRMAKRQGNKKNKKIPNKMQNMQNEQASGTNNEFFAEDPKAQKKLIRSHNHLNTGKATYLEDENEMNKEYYKYSDYRIVDKNMRGDNMQQGNMNMGDENFMKMKLAAKINENQQNFNQIPSPDNMNMLNMQNYQNDPMKGIFEIMQNLSYTNTNTNQVNAQLFQGMLNAQMKGNLQNMPGIGNNLGDFSQLGNKAYSPEVLQMIKRFIQTASGGQLSYGGYQQNNYGDSFNTKAKFPLPKAAYHVGIAYHIWYRQGNFDKDPTQYARKIKQMIIIKSQRQEMQDAGTKYPLDNVNYNNDPQYSLKQTSQNMMGNLGQLKDSHGMRTEEEINQLNMQIMENMNQQQQQQLSLGLKESPAASQTGGFTLQGQKMFNNN